MVGLAELVNLRMGCEFDEARYERVAPFDTASESGSYHDDIGVNRGCEL
jgi:hypothetical protein